MQTHLRNPHKWPGTPVILFCVFASRAFPQAPADDHAGVRQILERLDRLERQNQELTEELRALRKDLALARGATSSAQSKVDVAKTEPAETTKARDLGERMDVQERRLEEQAQTKVEASQHLPIRITGMALFNSYLNSNSGNPDVPVVVTPGGGSFTGGATLRQTVLGLDFRGPEIFGGGRIRGFLNMDFFGDAGEPYGTFLRIRTGGIEFNWENTTLMFGQDKPLISPREPNSLAQVWVSPLTAAGNLWVWQPQVRVEQRFHLNENTILRAQAGLFETREAYGNATTAHAYSIQSFRPSAQGRVALARTLDDSRRVEIGSGFSASTTHVAETTVPSRVLTLDWFANPWRKLEFSGAFFRGQNVTNLGGAGTGFTLRNYYHAVPVHADGGWAQLSFLATPRLTFNLFGGQQQNRGRDLWWDDLAKNQAYGANVMYRLAPNVIISLESEQLRSNYLATGNRLNNHYDLGLAYLF
jgi:hypothetical protein